MAIFLLERLDRTILQNPCTATEKNPLQFRHEPFGAEMGGLSVKPTTADAVSKGRYQSEHGFPVQGLGLNTERL